MKLALIPPFQMLGAIEEHSTGYQLMLAHLFDENYIESFGRDTFGLNDYIIVDNGAYEGSLVTPAQLIQCAQAVDANEIVIPDQMRNRSITKAMAIAFHEMLVVKGLDGAFNLMFVAQGKESFELYESINWAIAQPWINTIALPKHLLETLSNPRARIILAKYIIWQLDAQGIHKDIHFLGGSPLWNKEFVEAAQISGIRGMDTSMPFVYGINNKYLSDTNDYIERPGDYFNVESELGEVCYDNCQWMLNQL